MEIEVGVGLIRLADPKRGGDLLERIQRVRQSVAAEIGIIMPKVRIRDNMRLDPNEYRIKIADMPVAAGPRRTRHAAGDRLGRHHRQDRRHRRPRTPPSAPTPSGSIPARKDEAEMLGYTVVEPGAVIATHMTEVVPPPRRRNPHPRRDEAPDRRAQSNRSPRWSTN